MGGRKTILVSACGSSIGLEVLRSIRMAERDERVIGMEVSWWGSEVAREYCDEVIIVPRGDDANYASNLIDVIETHSVDLLFLNTEPEIEAIIDVRDSMNIPVSCCYSDGLSPCLDKKHLHERLEGLGITARTKVVENIDDISIAISDWGPKVWLRCTKGPRGNGSIIIEDTNVAELWINKIAAESEFRYEWMVHEFLPGRNYNWTSLWKEGELLMASSGERLEYFMADVSISGVTGNVSNCRTIDSETIQKISIEAVKRSIDMPSGIFSVDLKGNKNDHPIVTEINARQAFRPLLYAKSGKNFSLAFIDSFLHGLDLGRAALNEPPIHLEMIRGMDFEPIFRKVR
tara:strand:+ start:1346 stop:2383 length:1038 start_codon:yes stop_codon:yes gene_type:complete